MNAKNFYLEVSDIGKEMLAFQEDLASIYKYKKLPKDVENKVHNKYFQMLPACFIPRDEFICPVFLTEQDCAIFKGYEVFSEKFPIYSREGTQIASKYDRVVIGDYGAFIEIDQQNIVMGNICVKKGQEYRIHDERYSKNVKYQWFTTNDNTDCKLYFQQRGVTYADYKPGKWYISPYEVLNKEEFEQLIMMPDIVGEQNELFYE